MRVVLLRIVGTHSNSRHLSKSTCKLLRALPSSHCGCRACALVTLTFVSQFQVHGQTATHTQTQIPVRATLNDTNARELLHQLLCVTPAVTFCFALSGCIQSGRISSSDIHSGVVSGRRGTTCDLRLRGETDVGQFGRKELSLILMGFSKKGKRQQNHRVKSNTSRKHSAPSGR